MLNKPRGCVTTRSDPEQRPTVMQFVKQITERVYPVGRLDYHSEGLILLTNDGEFSLHAVTFCVSPLSNAFVLNADITMIPGFHDDLHHLAIVADLLVTSREMAVPEQRHLLLERTRRMHHPEQPSLPGIVDVDVGRELTAPRRHARVGRAADMRVDVVTLPGVVHQEGDDRREGESLKL